VETLRTLQSLCDALTAHRERTAIIALRRERPDVSSYTRLSRRVQRLAAGLHAAGLAPGEPVALLAGDSPEWIAACLAVLRAGAVVAPFDLQYTDESLAHVLDDSGARFVFTTSSELPRLERVVPGAALRVVLLDEPAGDARSWRRLLPEARAARRAALPVVAPQDPAALFYTSGTTGPPKGVPLTHGNLASQLNALIELDLLEHDDRVLLPLPLHHVYPFVIGMLMPLVFGMTIVLPQALTGPELIRALQEQRATVILGVPRLYRALLDGIEERAASRGRLAAFQLRALLGLSTWLRRRLGLRVGRRLLKPLHARLGPQLRLVISGGAALDPELAWRLEGLGWDLGSGYGLTETAPMLTIDRPGQSRIGSVGRPIPGVRLRIAPLAASEGEDGAPAGGEIQALGPNVFSGYRHLPERTAEAFTGDGWFRTGDLGHFDSDGWLYVDGRSTELIKTESGEKIQPEAIEQLLKESPALREVAVLQVDRRLVALAVPETAGTGSSRAELQRAVEEAVRERTARLPSYARITAVAIAREPLPRTRLGKLRRHLLPELYERSRPGRSASRPAARPVEIDALPASDRALLEHPAARATWELLAERHPRVGLTPDSNLQLDLDVDSLEWLNLTLALGQRAGVELEESLLAGLETVRDLLRAVAEARPLGTQPSASPLDEPERTLSPLQRRWLQPPGALRRAVAAAGRAINRVLARLLFRVRAEGLENLPATGPFVLTPNHASHLDAFLVAAVLDPRRVRQTYWAAWTGVAFTNLVVRALSRIGQVVPVDPERGAASSLAFGAIVLRRGQSLVWFPEGRRSDDGRLQPFKSGLGMILERVPVPVIPVRIEGSFEALPRGRIVPRPRRVTVRFGRPLDPRELERRGTGQAAAERIVDALQRQVAGLGPSAPAPRRPTHRPGPALHGPPGR